MAETVNPYLPPQSRDGAVKVTNPHVDAFAYSKWLVAVSMMIGGLATAIAIYQIYVDDPRTGTQGPTLLTAVSLGTALSASVWAISGWLQRRGMRGLVFSILVAVAITGLWIGFGGTYADVLAAAACVAWPFGGLAASVAVYVHRRMELVSEPQEVPAQ